ncbi:MAG: MFS transporter [Blautia sp.]|nr:MFS transporter [Blautia sp.]
MSEKKESTNKIGIGKFWGWQARAVSLGCVTIIYSYFMIFCTDTLGLNAAIVGTLLLVSKVFDGVTDLFAGYVIDNTNTRFGKARPYEFCIVGVWAMTLLLFSCPAGWSTIVKYIWVFVGYTFINSILVTFLNVNQSTYMVRSFPNQAVMVKLNSFGGIVITLGCAVVSMSFPQLMGTLASAPGGWTKLMAIYCIPLALIGMLRFLLVKEEVDVDQGSDSKVNLKEMGQVLKTNKWVYFVCLAYLLYNATLGLNAATYYFTYVVGDIGKYSIIMAMSMPMMVVMFVFPALMKKMRLSRLVMLGAAVAVAGGIINFLAGTNMGLLILGSVLVTFGGLPLAYVGGMMMLDCGEFNVCNGLPMSLGTMSAFQSFGSKVGQGVGSALLGILLSAGGFIEGAAVANQPDSAFTMIRVLYSVVPAILFALIFVILHFYKLEVILPGLREKKQKI